MPSELTNFQREVGEWADRTFPQSTPRSMSHHLTEEVRELGKAVYAVQYGLGSEAEQREEAADCLLILLHLAHRCGFDLLAEARKKHAINQQRKWGQADERGVVRHVEEATDAE